MIDPNDPVAVAALREINFEIGNLYTSNAVLSARLDSALAVLQERKDRIAAYETQVADMGLTNRNLMDQLDVLRMPRAMGG